MIIASKSRSPQIAAAARLLTISWAFSIQLWLLLDGVLRSYAFCTLDLVLAAAFFQLSRGKWFPVPLFFLHLALAFYHLYAALAGASIVWIAVYANRAFEAALLYVFACAIFRISTLRKGQTIQNLF